MWAAPGPIKPGCGLHNLHYHSCTPFPLSPPQEHGSTPLTGAAASRLEPTIPVAFPSWFNFRVCLILQKVTVRTAFLKGTLPQHCKSTQRLETVEASFHPHCTYISQCLGHLTIPLIRTSPKATVEPRHVQLYHFAGDASGCVSNSASNPSIFSTSCITQSNLPPLSTHLIRCIHRGRTPYLIHHTYPPAGMSRPQNIRMALAFIATNSKSSRRSHHHHRPQILGRVTSQVMLLH